jgi:hypothetical protein
MSVNVEELSSEVSVEGGATSPQAEGAAPQAQDEDARLQMLLKKSMRDRLRTASRGFDD